MSDVLASYYTSDRVYGRAVSSVACSDVSTKGTLMQLRLSHLIALLIGAGLWVALWWLGSVLIELGLRRY